MEKRTRTTFDQKGIGCVGDGLRISDRDGNGTILIEEHYSEESDQHYVTVARYDINEFK